MLLFRSEEDVAPWCNERGVEPGAVLSLTQVWELSKLWYGDRLEEGFHGRSIAEAERIFQRVGLQGPFWE